MFPRTYGSASFLQPSRHLTRSCASNLCKFLAVMSQSSTSFHLFFGLPFLSQQLLNVVPLLGLFLHPFSPHAPTIAIFALSETLPISTPVISRIFSLFILSFKVFPHIIRNILISVVFNFQSSTSSTFNAQHLAP